MLRPRTYDIFIFKGIKRWLHRLTPEKVDAGRFWKRPSEVQLPLDAGRGLSTKPTNSCVKSVSADV
jgi:hypothetical protein